MEFKIQGSECKVTGLGWGLRFGVRVCRIPGEGFFAVKVQELGSADEHVYGAEEEELGQHRQPHVDLQVKSFSAKNKPYTAKIERKLSSEQVIFVESRSKPFRFKLTL